VYAAACARHWHHDVLPVARIGRGFPAELLGALQRAGLAAGLVPSDRNAIRLTVHWGVEGAPRFEFAPGSGTYEELAITPEEIPAAALPRLEAVHVAPLPYEATAALVCWARTRARLVTVDPHYEHVAGRADDWRELLPLVDVFLPSREEAQDLLGGWPDAVRAAPAIAALGAELVVLKLGAEGSLAYRRSDRALRLGPPAAGEMLDSTGSGDAFCGGFLAGLVEGCAIDACLRRGAVSASLAAADHGAAQML
jgi:ribokinase